MIPKAGTAVVAPQVYSYLVNYLTNRGYAVFGASPQEERYPKDAGLCVCRVGKHIICNPKTVDPVLRAFLTGSLIDVKQGYTKCSVCVISDEAVITSDTVIAKRAAQHNIDVLQIAPGDIRLDGFPTGFIGGASFLIDDHTMAFTGTLQQHPDQERILSFLKNHGIRPVFLTEEPIFDIGGAVPLP